MHPLFYRISRAALLTAAIVLIGVTSPSAQSVSDKLPNAHTERIMDSLEQTLHSLQATIHRIDSLSEFKRQDADRRMREASRKLEGMDLSTESGGKAALLEFMQALGDQVDCTASNLKWSATSMSNEIENLAHTLESLENTRHIASTQSSGMDVAFKPLCVHTTSSVPEQIGTGIIPSLETLNDWQQEDAMEQEQALTIHVVPLELPRVSR